MSELKVIKIELNNHGKPIASIQGTTSYYGISPNDTFYPKSEADKVIAEKDTAIEELRNEADVYKEKYEQEYDIAVHNEKQLSTMRIEIRRQKYKRCLAMAKWCEDTAQFCRHVANTLRVHATMNGEPSMMNPDRFFKRCALLAKWHKRWLELADKFKEAK